MSAERMLRDLIALVGRDATALILRDAMRADSPLKALREAHAEAWRWTAA